MVIKALVTEALEQLPDQFTMDDLFERLVLIEAIGQGRRDYAEGNTVTHEELAKELGKWLK